MSTTQKKRGDTASGAAPKDLPLVANHSAGAVSREAASSDISSRRVDCCVGSGPTDVAPVARRFDTFAEFEDFVLKEEGRSGTKGGRYICGPLDSSRPNHKGSVRNKLAALPRRWTAADIDGCAPDEARALTRWAKQWRGFAYGTSRDSESSRRFRLVWELAAPIDRTAGIALGRWIETEIGRAAPSAKVDGGTFLAEQPIYLPLMGAWSIRWDNAEPMPLRTVDSASRGSVADEGLRSMDARTVPSMTLEHAADLLDHLPAHWGTPESGTWYRVAAALHLQFDGSDDAYEVLDAWSRGRQGYDAESNRVRWDIGFTHEGNTLTMFGLAREAETTGWTWPTELRESSGYRHALDAKGNAAWFLERVGDRYLNLDPTGGGKDCALLSYVGTHWRFGNELRNVRLDMERLEQELHEQADELDARGDAGRAGKLRAWATKCRSKATVSETAWHLERLPELLTSLSAFDLQPNLLAVRNGVIDLDTGELMPHRPEQRVLSFVDVDYIPEATAPHWVQLLEHSSDGDTGWLDFVHRALGYSISGHVREQAMVFLTGLPATGKSTLMEALRDVLGSEIAQVLAISTVCVSTFGGAQYELASLVGKRIAVVPEVNSQNELDVELLKRLSGGDSIKARMIRQEPVEFRPRAKVFLVGNSLPAVDASNEAFWRRVYVVPFEHVVPKDRRDKHLADRLREEAPGILAWLVRGYRRWLDQPLGSDVPDAVRNAGARYRARADAKELWYATRTEPRGSTPSRVLHRDFCDWLAESQQQFPDAEPVSEKAFGMWLDGKGHSVHRTAKARVRQSIRLLV